MIVKPIAGPRCMVVAARSFAGSRAALLDAAMALTSASGAIKLGPDASNHECYKERDGREFMAHASLMTSELPVDQILGLLRGVEERLRDPSGDPARPTIEIRPLWIEGVEVNRPDLVLPSPLIFSERWANAVFTDAAVDAFMAAVARGTEGQATALRIELSQKHFIKVGPNPTCMMPPGGLGELLEREKNGTRWRSWAVGEADLIARAGMLALLSYQERRRAAADRKVLEPELAIKVAGLDLAEVMPEYVEPITTGLTPVGATLENRADLWLRKIAARAAHKDRSIALVVVWEFAAREIRGALLIGPPHGAVVPGPIEELRFGKLEGTHREVSFLAR